MHTTTLGAYCKSNNISYIMYIRILLVILICVLHLIVFSQQLIFDDINRINSLIYSTDTVVNYEYDKLGNRTLNKIVINENNRDLLSYNITGLTIVSAGNHFDYSFEISNTGNLISGQVEIFVKINDQPNLINATLLETVLSPSINPGSTFTGNVTITIPANTLPGNYFIIVQVDPENVIEETDESNNIAYLPVALSNCEPINIEFPIIMPESCGSSNGSITANASGAEPPFIYTWSTIPFQVGEQANNLSAGIYTVTVTNFIGCQEVASQAIINTGDTPESEYEVEFIGLEGHFTCAAAAEEYHWDFGDGDSSLIQNPVHTYSDGGNYLVCLTVSNSCGSDQHCTYIVAGSNNCIAPIDLDVEPLSGTSATVSWTEVNGATGYNLQYRHIDSSAWIPIANIQETSWLLFGLEPLSTYEIQIQSICDNEESPYSASDFFMTLEGLNNNTFYKRFDHLNGTTWQGYSGRLNDGTFIIAGENYINPNKGVYFNVDVNGNILWEKDSHTEVEGQARPQYITPTSDGGFIYTFTRSGFVEYTPNWSTDIVKMDVAGEIEFQYYYEDSGTNRHFQNGGHCIELSNGDLLKYEENVNNTSGGPNLGFCFLRTNPDGLFQSAKTFTHPTSLHIGKLFEDSSGNIIAVGYFGDITESQPYVVKYNPINQSILWAKKIDASESDIFIDIAETNDGYLLCGNTESFSTGRYAWVVKLDFNGNLIFNKTYEFAHNDGCRQIMLTADGKIIIGNTGSVIKLEPNGDLIWARKFNHASFIQNRNYHLLENGQIVGVGFSFGQGPNGRDYHMIRLNPNGTNCITVDVTPTITNRTFTISNLTFGTYLPPINTYTLDVLVPYSINMETDTVCQVIPCAVSAATFPAEIIGCHGMTADIHSTAINTNELSWFFNPGGIALSDSTVFTFELDSSLTDTVFLIAGSGSCLDTAYCPITYISPEAYELDIAHVTCTSLGSAAIIINSSDVEAYWSTGDTGVYVSNLLPGTYQVMVIDSLGCSGNSTFEILDETYELQLTDSIQHQTCAGNPDGSIQLVISGYTGDLSYIWSDGSIANPNTNLGPGDYSVTVTDGLGCYVADNFTVLAAVPIAAEFQIEHESEPGAEDAIVNAGVIGGLPPYSLVWSTLDTGSVLTGISTGDYHLIVTDANACSYQANFSVFAQIESDSAVQLFTHQSVGHTPDFVQVINLEEGAKIEFHTGNVVNGAGSDSPTFMLENLNEVWDEKSASNAFTFSITNGAFFSDGISTSELLYPVKENNTMISLGSDSAGLYLGQKQILHVFSENAESENYPDIPDLISSSSSLSAIVGLSTSAQINPNQSEGRTWMGITDKDSNGIYEKVVIFTSASATSAYALNRLKDLGVETDRILQLQGGNSTQVRCNNIDYITSPQEIPQSIVVYKAGVHIEGCRDTLAHNYNPLATIEDGSCETCHDCIQNGDETGVDCGGILCQPCQISNIDGEVEIFWSDEHSVGRSIAGHPSPVTMLIALEFPSCIEIDPSEQMVVWADQTNNTVRRSYITGSEIGQAHSAAPNGMALNLVTKEIIWSEGNFIRKCSYAENSVQNILSAGIGTPGDLAMNAEGSMLYIADVLNDDILRYQFEDQSLDTFILPSYVVLGKIALNSQSNTLYYMDLGLLKSLDLNTGVSTLLSNLSIQVDELEYDEISNQLFITSGNTNKVYKCNSNGSGLIEIATGMSNPRGLAIVPGAESLYVGNLNSDNIVKIDVASGQKSTIWKSTFNYSRGVAYSYEVDSMYWSELGPPKIRKASLNNLEPVEIVSTGLSSPRSLALNEEDNILFWSDWGKPFISKVNTNGTDRDTFVATNYYTEDIEWVESTSELYWCNRWDNAILKCNADGSEVDTILTGINLANSIAIDEEENVLYWTTLNSSNIFYKSLGAGGIVQQISCNNLPVNDVEFSVIDRKVYWSDKNTGKILRCDPGGLNLEEVIQNTHSPFQISVHRSDTCGLVTTTLDSLAGSIIHSINCSDEGDTIRFHPGLSRDTIRLTNNHVLFNKNLTLLESKYNIFIIDMAFNPTIEVQEGKNVVIEGLSIITANEGEGLAILNHGNLTLHNVNIYKRNGDPGQIVVINQGDLTIKGNTNIKLSE